MIRTLGSATFLLFTFAIGLVLPIHAQTSPPKEPPIAVDDHRLVDLMESSVEIPFSWLLNNDEHSQGAVITEVRTTQHGNLEWLPADAPSFVLFTPADSFWGVGSDSFVYRIETSKGASIATVHLAAERRRYRQMLEIDFEGQIPDPLGPGLSIETQSPLIGLASLAVSVTDGSQVASSSIVLPGRGTDTGEHEEADLDLCAGGVTGARGGSATEEAGAAHDGSNEVVGYLLLAGPENISLDLAAIRVGLLANSGGIFVEVKQGGSGTWHRSTPLAVAQDTVRISLSWERLVNQLVALLRIDGLAARTPAVFFNEAAPEFAHIGFFQPEGGGSTADILIDRVEFGIRRDARQVSFNPLEMADGFEDGTVDKWGADYGSSFVVNPTFALTDGSGLGIVDFSDAPSFVSYQPVSSRLREISVHARLDVSSFSILPGAQFSAMELLSTDHPLFGTAEYQLRLSADNSGLLASIWFRKDDQLLLGTPWVPITGVNTLRLQIGKSDGPGIDNGWMRLWKNGQIAVERKGLPNDDLEFRTVHVGAKSFVAGAPLGTLIIDDVTITR